MHSLILKVLHKYKSKKMVLLYDLKKNIWSYKVINNTILLLSALSHSLFKISIFNFQHKNTMIFMGSSLVRSWWSGLGMKGKMNLSKLLKCPCKHFKSSLTDEEKDTLHTLHQSRSRSSIPCYNIHPRETHCADLTERWALTTSNGYQNIQVHWL